MQTLLLNDLFAWLGLTGSLVLLLSVSLPMFFYRGKHGQRYDLRNHFISELGEVGVSRLAFVFNTGLILGGLLLLPFCIGLGRSLPGTWGTLAGIAGALASLAAVLVGVFPMNNMAAHIPAATWFFRLGLVTIALFTLAIANQPSDAVLVPRLVNFVGVPAILVYAAFLYLSPRDPQSNQGELQPGEHRQRPRFWLVPMLEWAIFISTLVWFLSSALNILLK
ncbi:MAG: DUF998 domain-containing protein [Longilinea sp.]|nr:DUF998 domain-containing protein [Longilinea sp.]MCA1954460.1 DUF998 domain-containing protein [Anaerolinea sp.]